MDQAQVASKPSGLPRPSRLPTRLPVLAKKTSTTSISSQQDLPPPSRPGVEKLGLPTKKPSVPSLRRPNPEPRITVPTPRKTGISGPRPDTATPSGSARSIPARPPSRLRRPPQTSTPVNHVREAEEHHDQLGSLDGFRAASRQGFYDDAPEPEEYVEPALPEPPTPKTKKPSRPSLSDRTIESLQSVPSTPKERRRSSFFAAESPMGPPPRPGSALSRNGSSGNSRPSTSDGSFVKPGAFSTAAKKAPVSAKPAARTSLGGFGFTPNGGRRSVSTSFSTKLQSSSTKAPVPPSPRAASPSKPMSMAHKSKTFSARPSKPRPALGDAFSPVGQASEPKPSAPKPATASSPANSSAALRQQIAAAKAAARKEREKGLNDSPQDAPVNGTYEYDASADPFNTAPKDGKHMLRTRVNAARMSGKLNIAAMELKTIPSEVMHMFDAAAMEESKVNWAEVVDLTKFIAADNELEEIEADVFPDTSIDDFNMADEAQGNQFGGLELLDLHGNSLSNIPLGLRRLERLTTLNLAHNKLDNSVLEVISQIKPLKELKLGHNNISGHLPASICELTHLETLDLQANRLLALPAALRELTSLRVLNISGNQLTALPMDALQSLPLAELDASSNALIGSLFPLGGASEHLTLRSLNIANNSLAALTFSASVDFPRLTTLNVTNNHLTSLPPVSVWTELITLAAGDNKISELPEGFTELARLRNVNFSGNDLHVLPPQVANMEGLESLVLASNPMRERKYLTMSATDIKRDLRAKLEPEEADGDDDVLGGGESGVGAGSSSGPRWTIGANGLLDLSGQGLTDDIDARLAVFLSKSQSPVRQLLMQNNKLTRFPSALTLASDLRMLDLSNNPFTTDYLREESLELPHLTSLRLKSLRLTSLDPLLSSLSAPNLQTLDLTANALSGPLPTLRQHFPALTTALASDNKFTTLSADDLRGLATVNLASNELQSLPAEIGLLWEEGLRNFEVGRNAFRVPGWRVLEKGTEGLLRWLRGRLPDAPEEDLD